jgi:nitronate monooxygenase
MSRRNEAVSRLGIDHPIIQGPFGGGLSTPRLVAAVSNLGGLGSFGAYHLAPDAIGPLAAGIRALTAGPSRSILATDHDEGGERSTGDSTVSSRSSALLA